MKIGVLTFHYPNNYGALLQSYSLISYLRKMNMDAEIIDYVPLEFNKASFFSGSHTLRGLVGNILRFPFYKKWLIRNSKLNSFRNEKIVKSARVDVSISNFHQYDIVVTGSDQTFNRKLAFTNIYYQNYVKVVGQRKIAYAPSFGSMDLSARPDSDMLKLLMDFDSLSCREKDGADYLAKYTGYSVQHVLDPVFLTDKESWNNLATIDIPYKDYIFIYDLNGKMQLINIAKNKFPDKKLVVFSNDTLMPYYAMSVPNLTFVQDIGIEGFLSYIKNADYVLTDSFHGTAFSVIFEKQFNVYIALEKAACRIQSLLSQLNLENRIIATGREYNLFIDYSVVNVMLYSLIHKSKRYLLYATKES